MFVFFFQVQDVIISGIIKDGENGEDFIGVIVVVLEFGFGIFFNVYGFYFFFVFMGDILNVVFSYVGFQFQIFSLLFWQDIIFNINLIMGV